MRTNVEHAGSKGSRSITVIGVIGVSLSHAPKPPGSPPCTHLARRQRSGFTPALAGMTTPVNLIGRCARLPKFHCKNSRNGLEVNLR